MVLDCQFNLIRWAVRLRKQFKVYKSPFEISSCEVLGGHGTFGGIWVVKCATLLSQSVLEEPNY